MRRKKAVAILSLLSVLMLVVSACGGTAKKEEPTPAPKAETPAPAPKPEEKKPAEAPKKNMKLVIVYPSIPDMTDAPSLLAWEELTKMGYDVVPKFLAKSELVVEALVRGDAQIGTTSFPYLPAVLQGAPITGFMQQIGVEWTLVARGNIKTLEDLDGKKLAQHSAGSLGKAMTDAVFNEKKIKAKPNVLYVPGSENRADAIIKGSIDATPVELADLVRLQKNLKDLNTVISFTEELPHLMANVMLTTNDFYAKNPEVVKDIIKALVTTYRKVYDDPAWFIERIPKVLPTLDTTDMDKVVDLYRKYKVYPVNGGLTAEDQQYTIDFFTRTGQLDKGLTPSKVYDRKLLDEVLKDIGSR